MAALWGQRTGRDVSQTRLRLGGSKRATKKDGALLPSFESVRRLAFPWASPGR